MYRRRLVGIPLGLALSATLAGSALAQTPCDTLFDLLLVGDARARSAYELRCGDPRLERRLFPVSFPRERIDFSPDEEQLIEVSDDVQDRYMVLAGDVREDVVDAVEE